MKVVFHLSTPKQVRFFAPLAREVAARGHDTRFVTRDYMEVDLLVERLGIEAERIGRHGGASLLDKILASAERVEALAHYLDRERPDVVVALGCHAICRAAFGLGIPVVAFNDIPEYEALARLTLPLATRVCAPWVVPPEVFARLGVTPERLFRYPALDPVAWLDEHPVDPGAVARLGLDPGRPLVVCRETEWQSGYVRTDVVRQVGEALGRRHPDWQVLSIPRYQAHPFYDTPSLLARADLLLGGGGTMCVEAAYYGTPVVATRDLDCRYMAWLFEHGLAVEARSRDEALTACEKAMEAGRRDPARARRLLGSGRFPLGALAEQVLACGGAPRPDPAGARP